MNETPGEREFPDASETSSNSRLSFLASKLMLEQKQNADNKENLAPSPPPQPQQKPHKEEMPQQRCQRPQLKRITVTSF